LIGSVEAAGGFNRSWLKVVDEVSELGFRGERLPGEEVANLLVYLLHL
jgi:hypothetical protein